MVAPLSLGDSIRFAAYNATASEESFINITWSQRLSTKTVKYYIVEATNKSKGNVSTFLYIEDSFYKDQASPNYLGSQSGFEKNGDDWVVTIDKRFQYGQKNAAGEDRWFVLHNKANKPYQHRFLISTIQGQAAGWAKTIANSFGAKELADNVYKLGSSFVGDYLHDL